MLRFAFVVRSPLPYVFAALASCRAVGRELALPPSSFTLASHVLSETRRINVYTPPGYELDRDARYPVLYMPDGGLQEDFPHITAAIDAAIRDGATSRVQRA